MNLVRDHYGERFLFSAVVNGCVIRKTKRNDDYISQGSPTYFCRSVTNVTQKEVHIISMYGKSGHDQSFIKFVTADDSRGKDVVLVLANFLKTRWNLDISNKVNLKKIYLVSKILTVFKERRSLRKV